MNTKLINDLTKCVTLREASHTNFFYSNGNLSDQLRKCCHKFTHILHFQSYRKYQSCEQEDFNSINKFLHLIGSIIEQR